MKRALLLLTFAWLTPACAYLRSPKNPMPVVRFSQIGAGTARGIIVLLPGFGDRPETFEKRGFVAALRRHAPEYDVIAADAHFGYYRERQLLPRLHDDVIEPLRAEGYRNIWLAGASMGGFGGVGYARTHPELVSGLLLFAPYMGPRKIVQEVQRVGLCAYRPTVREPITDQDSFARANFDFLRQLTCERRDVPLWLAVGADDDLLAANQTLRPLLTAERFRVLPGGHGWKVWTPAVQALAPALSGE
ncbi:MAG TPA: alpha/beta fold hydrolase [Polyangiales bacterium]